MQSLESNGVVTAYEQTGHGEPIVLLHGGEADHSMFDGLARELSAHFNVIAYDQRDSGCTRNPPSSYSLADLADDAAALIRAWLRTRPCLRHFTGRIGRASAGGASPRLDRSPGPEQHLEGQQEPARRQRRRLPHAGVVPRRHRRQCAEDRRVLLPAGLPACPARTDRDFPWFDPRRRPEGATRRLLAQPVAADLAGFDRPTLLLVGGEDRLIPNAETFALARDLAHVETRTIANAATSPRSRRPNGG